MILIPLLFLFVGVLLGLITRQSFTGQLAIYAGVACLAGFDTVCGGVRSLLEGKYATDIFVTGFISNILIAFFLAWLGDSIGINLFLAVALVLGTRTFTNLSIIRRLLIGRWQDKRARKRLELEKEQVNLG